MGLIKFAVFMAFLMTSVFHFSVESDSSNIKSDMHSQVQEQLTVVRADTSSCPIHSESGSSKGSLPHCVQCDAFHHCAFLSPSEVKLPPLLESFSLLSSAETNFKNLNLSGLLRPPRA